MSAQIRLILRELQNVFIIFAIVYVIFTMLFLFGFNKNERFRSYSLIHNEIAIENYGTTEYELQTQIPAPPTVHEAKRTLTIPYEIRHATPPPDGLKRHDVNIKEIHDFDDIDNDHSEMDDFGNELKSTIGEEDSIKNTDDKNQSQADMKEFGMIDISDYSSNLSKSNNLTGFLTPVLLPETTLQQPNNYR